MHSDEQRSVCGVSVWLCAHSYRHHTPTKSKLISNDHIKYSSEEKQAESQASSPRHHVRVRIVSLLASQ